MADRIKYIHNLKENEEWSPRYPIGVDGINVDLFNEFNLEEELKIGGGNHSIEISDNNNNNENFFDIEEEDKPDFLDNITQGDIESSTKIAEEYDYATVLFNSLIIIDEFPATKEENEETIEYTLTIIRIQLDQFEKNNNNEEENIKTKTIQKAIFILENDSTTKIQEVIVQ